MDSNEHNSRPSPDLNPAHELPAPHDIELPAPHDMLIKPHLTHRHSWLHWLPALLGLTIGILIGIFVTQSAPQNREQINQFYKNQQTLSPKPTINNPKDNNWQIYKSTSTNLTFKYPANWYIGTHENTYPELRFFHKETKADFTDGDHAGNEVMIVIIGKTTKTIEEEIASRKLANNIIPGYLIDKTLINGYEAFREYNRTIGVKSPDGTLAIFMLGSSDIQNTLKEISSTIKFLPASPALIPSTSPSVSITQQISCTLDVRQCPDGSWVSRSGPNCEFLPCTTRQP